MPRRTPLAMRLRLVLRAWFIVTALSLVGTPVLASGSAPPLDPMQATPSCDDGQAIVETPEGLPLVVGGCDEEIPAGGSGAGHGTVDGGTGGRVADRPLAGPEGCPIPGFDDRCEAWTASPYDGPWASSDYAGFGSFDRHRTVIAHPTEDLVFVGGTSAYANGDQADADFVEIAYRASTGQPVWTATWEGLDDRTLAYQHSIALSPDGERLYGIGDAAVPGVYSYVTVIVAFDTTTGTRLWAQRSPISAEAIETAMTTLPDGSVEERIYVAGLGAKASSGAGAVPGGAVAALDPADGEAIWSRRVAGETPNGARFNELVVTPDGGTVIAGGGEHGADNLAMNYLTVAFDAVDGEQRWEARDERTMPERGTNGISDMGLALDGSVVLVTGFDPVVDNIITTPSESPILTVALDAATGEDLWRQRYGGPDGGGYYFSLFQGMMGVSPDGRTAVVTAAINSHNGTATVAYDAATGAETWGVEAPDGGFVFTSYLGFYPTVVMGDDRAYVSNRRGIGYSQYRTVTMAYSLTEGKLDWTARLGANRTLFCGSAIAPDGERVFVTTADRLADFGFPVPDPGLDSVDILTVSYEA